MTDSELYRVYAPEECGEDGYPYQWHGTIGYERGPAIKNLVRAAAGDRCQRCGHPYLKGMGEWSPCDEWCGHDGPVSLQDGVPVARWRILTVHHLNGVKADCRWWNLAALCQRCHLHIQKKVIMERVFPFDHTAWFRPHAAGWYAFAYLNEELSREETMDRMDELLALERMV